MGPGTLQDHNSRMSLHRRTMGGKLRVEIARMDTQGNSMKTQKLILDQKQSDSIF